MDVCQWENKKVNGLEFLSMPKNYWSRIIFCLLTYTRVGELER